MATSIGGVFIEIGAKTSPLFKGLANAEKGLKSSAARMQKIGTDLSLSITAPLALMGGAAFKMASDYEESLNKVRVAFGNSAGAVEAFSQSTLKNIGLAGGSALEMASLFGDMATSMGISQKDAAGLSTSLVTLAGDLASFKNISISEAQTALSGIFTGETESLKRLGVVMLDSTLQAFALTQGIQKQYKEFTQAEKVQLRYAYVMNATKNAQGDFANTSGGAANQMRIFQESVKQLSASFGTVLLPILTPIIKKANEMLQAFQSLTDGQKKTIIAFAGVAAAIGPLIIIGGQIVSAFGVIVGAMKTLAVASKATGLAMSLSLGPISLILVGIGAAAAALIYYWDDLKKAFDNLYVSSENFRAVFGGLKLLFDLMKAPAIALIDHFKNMFKALVNVVGVLSGEISIKDAFKNVSEDAYNLGKKFGDNIVKGFKNAETSNKLANLTKLTGIQPISGDRSASYKKLRETNKGGGSAPAASFSNPLGNVKSAEIKTLDQQISNLQERIKQLSIQYQTKPSESLLKNINTEIAKLKDKESILAKSEALIKKLSGIPPTFEIKGSLDFPLDEIRTDVANQLAEIDASIALGLETDGATAKIGVFTSAIKAAFAKTGDITDPLIQDLTAKLKAIQPPTFKFSNSLDDFKFDDILSDVRKKLETTDLNVSLGLETNGADSKIGIIKEAMLQLSAAGLSTSDAFLSLNTQLNGLTEGQAKMESFTESMNEIISGSLQESLALVGTTLGNLFTGDGGAAAFFGGMLNIVGDFAVGLGKQMIAIGAAGAALKKAFVNPIAASIAGIALIALGTVAKNYVAKGLPSLAIGTDYVKKDGMAILHKGEKVVPADVVKGGYTRSTNVVEEIALRVMARVQGPDLIYAMNYAAPINKRFR